MGLALATTAETPEDDDFVETAATIGREVLAPVADEVDVSSRFPHEALAALREAGMLGALVPTELGGQGRSVTTVSRAITELSMHCSSAAMIFAMHHMQLACLVQHGDHPALRDFTERVAREGLLLASATTEVGIGGDVRRSSCCVEPDGEGITLQKQAPVISYGQYADAILATARRTPESAPSDQVLVLCRAGDYTLDPTGGWDALGFRGTCSLGFVLTHHGSHDDVLPTPYGEISTHTMLPVAHVLWSSLWYGLARAAELKARTFVQSAARRQPEVTPPGALRLAELAVEMEKFRDLVEGGRRRFHRSLTDPAFADSPFFAVSMNSLKVGASTTVVECVQKALLICGMAGYVNKSPFTLARLLRDSYGAQLMVNNDRIFANTSQVLLAHRGAHR